MHHSAGRTNLGGGQGGVELAAVVGCPVLALATGRPAARRSTQPGPGDGLSRRTPTGHQLRRQNECALRLPRRLDAILQAGIECRRFR